MLYTKSTICQKLKITKRTPELKNPLQNIAHLLRKNRKNRDIDFFFHVNLTISKRGRLGLRIVNWDRALKHYMKHHLCSHSKHRSCLIGQSAVQSVSIIHAGSIDYPVVSINQNSNIHILNYLWNL